MYFLATLFCLAANTTDFSSEEESLANLQEIVGEDESQIFGDEEVAIDDSLLELEETQFEE